MMHRSIDRKLRFFFYYILFLLLSTQISKNNNIKNNISFFERTVFFIKNAMTNKTKIIELFKNVPVELQPKKITIN